MKKLTRIIFLFLLTGLFTAVSPYPAAVSDKEKKETPPEKSQQEKSSYWEHWQDIPFTLSKDFQHTINVVRGLYIDRANYNRNLCYVEAARYALFSLERGLDIFPESFIKRQDDFLDKDNRLKGSFKKLTPDDKWVIYIPDKDKQTGKVKKDEKTAEPLSLNLRRDRQTIEKSNQKIKKMMTRIKKRRRFITKEWDDIRFGERRFMDVLDYIVNHYKDDPKFNMKHVIINATSGYLHGLDPHCSLVARKSWEKALKKIQDASFFGIGAILQGGGQHPVVVVNPIEGRPAINAGLRAGDNIIEVDGKPVAGLTLNAVVKQIRGPKDTKVVLTVKRLGMEKHIKIPIVRAYIKIKNVQSKWVDDDRGIGYIKMRGFVRRSTYDISRHLQKLREQKRLRGLILDLRGNGGGYLSQATKVADIFLPQEKTIVSVRSSMGRSKTHQSKMSDLTHGIPLVVLVNSSSASASEIVSSALQDHGRALIIGRRTFGKATVQRLLPNSHSGDHTYYIKLTTQRYYAPSERTIQVVGVRPDVRVPTEPNGGFPYRYREADAWRHLPPIKDKYRSGNADRISALKNWVKKNGTAARYYGRHKKDAIAPDYQLRVGVDYIRALMKKN